MIVPSYLLALLQAAIFLPVLAQGQVCYMMYSLADTDLEWFLRQDLIELIFSPAISDVTLTTWIYFDQRNLPDSNQAYYDDNSTVITEELPFIYNMDGSNITDDKYEGSRYMTYDHGMSKMIVDTILDGEQNGDDPQTVYDFMLRALPDCVAKGAKEYFMMFSSHGSGIGGFGFDTNTGEDETTAFSRAGVSEVVDNVPNGGKEGGNPDLSDGLRRKLITNQDLVDAITLALADVDGAPPRLNVIGFDACLMNSLGAIDEYKDVADYILASEQIVPGHGLAYGMLDTASSALDMAKSFLVHFILETQADPMYADVHQAPKTMAIVDTTAFTRFLEAWEALSSEMLAILTANNDPSFFAALSRARAETLSFPGYPGENSAADIGVFLDKLVSICGIDSESTLSMLISDAMMAYDAQFVLRMTGNGTAPLTGMHMDWPDKEEFLNGPYDYTYVLFQEVYNDDAPQWMVFLETFLTGKSPVQTGDTSVCLASMVSSLEPSYEGQLLFNPSLYFDLETGAAIVSSEIALVTDLVEVDYGLNLTNLVVRRRLQEKLMNAKATSPVSTHGRKRRLSQSQRRDQADGDYYYFYGGKVPVEYDGSVAIAVWDGIYYQLNSTQGVDEVYVEVSGGQKSFPVCYFYPSNVRSPEDLVEVIDVAAAKASLGCVYGQVYWTTDENSGFKFTLFVHPDGEAPREMPPEAGGQIAPVVYVEVSLNGTVFEEIVGGFYETIIDWGADNGMTLDEVPDYYNIEAYGAESGVIGMYAYNFDAHSEEIGGFDSMVFPYFYELESSISKRRQGH